jgi:hypothetical protein
MKKIRMGIQKTTGRKAETSPMLFPYQHMLTYVKNDSKEHSQTISDWRNRLDLAHFWHQGSGLMAWITSGSSS